MVTGGVANSGWKQCVIISKEQKEELKRLLTFSKDFEKFSYTITSYHEEEFFFGIPRFFPFNEGCTKTYENGERLGGKWKGV